MFGVWCSLLCLGYRALRSLQSTQTPRLGKKRSTYARLKIKLRLSIDALRMVVAAQGSRDAHS